MTGTVALAQVDGGLASCLIEPGQQAFGFFPIGGVEAGAFVGGLVHRVKHPATGATVDQTVSGLHVIHRNSENNLRRFQ